MPTTMAAPLKARPIWVSVSDPSSVRNAGAHELVGPGKPDRVRRSSLRQPLDVYSVKIDVLDARHLCALALVEASECTHVVVVDTFDLLSEPGPL